MLFEEVDMSTFITNYGTLILEYIWIPIIIPVLGALGRFIIRDKLLYVKEIKKVSDSEVEPFSELYNERINESLRICVEEILQFVGRSKDNAIEHHLYICKKINKTVGFIKFMISKEQKYIFIAYVAVDKNDITAKKYGIKILTRKLAKKYFKPKIADCIIVEIEQNPEGTYKTALGSLIARYAKSLGKKSYYIDIPYIQPKMPNENYQMVDDKFLSLLYIPYFSKDNNRIAKNSLLKIIESIYFEIYEPSCDPSKGCNCDDYNEYLSNILSIYRDDLDDYIKLIPIER